MEAKEVFEHKSDHLLASVYSLKVIYDLRILGYPFTLTDTLSPIPPHYLNANCLLLASVRSPSYFLSYQM